jgi:chromosome segregation ATPase
MASIFVALSIVCVGDIGTHKNTDDRMGMNNQSMKERIIRQVEVEINTLSEKRDDLYSEIEKIESRITNVESEIAEARSMLVFLKTGKTVAPEKPRRKRAAAKSDAEYRVAIKEFGTKEFTSRQLAEKIGVSKDAASNKLNSLAKEGFVFVARHSMLGPSGRTPAYYQLRSGAISV